MSRLDPFTLVLRADPCSYCGEPSEALDHIDAQVHGGDDTPENLTAVCAPCNQSKKDATLLRFLLRRNRALSPREQMLRSFGQRVRARRIELSMTQKDLALALDADLMAVGRWERGASDPRGRTLVQIGRALGCNPMWFYEEVGAG